MRLSNRQSKQEKTLNTIQTQQRFHFHLSSLHFLLKNHTRKISATKNTNEHTNL